MCTYIELHAGPLDGMLVATELAELRKITTFEEKTQFLLNTLYMIYNICIYDTHIYTYIYKYLYIHMYMETERE